MNLKDRAKTYSFWVSLTSAIILILKVIGSKFGFEVDAVFVSDLVTSMCSVLVLLGIIVSPTSKQNLTQNEVLTKPVEQTIQEQTTETQPEEKQENSLIINKMPETVEEEVSANQEHFEKIEQPHQSISLDKFSSNLVPEFQSEQELEEYFNKQKEMFNEDVDLYIQSIKDEILAKQNTTTE